MIDILIHITVLTQLQAHKQMSVNSENNKNKQNNKINAKSYMAGWCLMAFSTEKVILWHSDCVPTE